MQCRCIKGLCPFFFFQQLLLSQKLLAMNNPNCNCLLGDPNHCNECADIQAQFTAEFIEQAELFSEFYEDDELPF